MPGGANSPRAVPLEACPGADLVGADHEARPIKIAMAAPVAWSMPAGAAAPPASLGPASGALAGDTIAREQALGTVVPDVHLNDLAIAHHKAVDITVALEWRAVGPFAVKGAEIVDDGFVRARDNVAPFHLLFHPFVARSIEGGGLARVTVAAPAGEGDLEIGGNIARRGDGVGHHRGNQELLDDFGGGCRVVIVPWCGGGCSGHGPFPICARRRA